MHILYPIGTFYPAQSGGPSNSVYWLARALTGQGVQVSVVATNTDQPATTPLDQWLDTEAGRVRYVRVARHTTPWQAIWQTVRLLPTVDIVHLTSLYYTLSIVVGFWALLTKKVVIWSPRGELASAALAIRPRLKRWVLWGLTRFRHRVVLHTTSAAESADARRAFGEQIRLIELPNYLELPPLMARQPSGYLLYLGRLHSIKGLDRLVDALALSNAFRSGYWQLRLVGADPDGLGATLLRQAEQRGVADRVRIEPPVFGQAKQHLLANAHVLLLPSHSENFGNVVVESLAQGTPVIASTGTPWAVLPKHEAGFWVDNEPAALSEAIDTCLSLPNETYNRYRMRARQVAEQQFDSTTNCPRWLAAYEAHLSTHPKPRSVCAE